MNRNRLILAIKQHGSTGAGAPIMMSRTTRAGLRLQWKNNLGFSGLRRLGFISIESIIKQTKFLNAWIDCCRQPLERSYTVSRVNTASVQAYRTRARPSRGTPLLPWDWSRGEYASPLSGDRHLRNRENQAHHADPGRNNRASRPRQTSRRRSRSIDPCGDPGSTRMMPAHIPSEARSSDTPRAG